MRSKSSILITTTLLCLLTTACSKSDDDGAATTSDTTGTTTHTSDSDADGDVSTFTIAKDLSALAETQVVDAADDDYVENTTIDQTLYVTFSDTDGASVQGDDDGLVTIVGNDVTATNTTDKVVQYVLSGTTTDGFFKLYSAKKSIIRLNGVSITNPDGAAINNQSHKCTFIVVADGTDNSLKDGTAYADATSSEDMKACLFSEGQLIFSGTGYLYVDGNCKAGIRSDDYVRTMPGVSIDVDVSSGNGIRGNESVTITGGVININVTGDADKGISTDGHVTVSGGRTTIITSGGEKYEDGDYSACAGVKADSTFTITGGELRILCSGTGGKGISCDQQASFSGGATAIITTGKNSSNTSAKGVKADGNLTISAGKIKVRCANSEAIESKAAIVISGGIVEVYGSDDCINSKSDMTISGGHIYCHATNNDAIDANRNLYINDGFIVAEGAGAPENALDAAEGYSTFINGGTIIALGGSTAATSSSSKQASIDTSVTQGQTVALASGSTTLVTYQVSAINRNTSALMISSPSLSAGSSYTLKSGVTTTGGTWFYGAATDATVSGGSSSTVTAALSVGSGMGGGNGGGGHGPGGRW